MTTAREHNRLKEKSWVGELGIEVVIAEPGTVVAQIQVQPEFLAPNGFIHAAVLLSFADSLCGSGTVEALPQGATGHTTIELKAIFWAQSARELWNAGRRWYMVAVPPRCGMRRSSPESGKTIALFRCTQLVLYPAVE